MNRAADVRNRLTGARDAFDRNTAQKARLETEKTVVAEDWTQLRDQAGHLARKLVDQRGRVEAVRVTLAEVDRRLSDARSSHEKGTERFCRIRSQYLV